ncbi:MAG TPA: cell division protein FtsA, partial [Myxococcales bacterium]|nr:cell division protein FtsA [Myxococcales bacterium]
MGRTGEILVGLDVGTTKVAAVVGEVREDGVIDIIGVGISPSHGVRKGMVVHADQTTDAISRAIREAEQMTGCTITAVYCNVSGSHLKSFNNRGVVSIANGRVSSEDVRRVIENARAVQIPADRQIIHTVPQEYLIDENDGYEDPLQIMGSRLQANVHIITALNSGIENVRQCPERAGLHVQRIYSGLLASSNAVLTRDEMELGVVMVDIGGGTT